MHPLKTCTIGAILLASAGRAVAQLHSGDIILKVDNGHIVTGATDENGQGVFPWRAFTSLLGKYGVPNATTDPGFDSSNGAFPPNATVGISVRKALRIWDGSSFDTIPGETMRLIKNVEIQTPLTDPVCPQVGPSLTLGKANASGKLHQHPGYILNDPAQTGIYLLELEAWVFEPGGSASEPFWILFNQNESDDTLTQALAFIQHSYIDCPADFNRDGSLDVDDFIAFQVAFAVGDPRADFDHSCEADIDDFIAFQSAFALGCP